MKVIEIPFCFYPDAVGGTEIYVESLSANLRQRGIEAVVAAPGENHLQRAYLYNRLPVRRFPTSSIGDLSELYGEGDREAAAAYGQILDEERPDLVHLHAFTSACSLQLVRETRKRGISTVFTYHTPTVSCQRGTLMRWGSEVCDGGLDLGICTPCTLHGLGLSRGLADVVGHAPVALGRALRSSGLSGGVWTALRMRELVHARHAAFRALMKEADHVIAVCEWVRNLLVVNGVPPAKITLSRQGLPEDGNPGLSQCAQHGEVHSKGPSPSSRSPVRVAFLGRLDPSKGAHILIDILHSMPDLPATLDLYGIPQGATGGAYFEHLQSLAGDDPRIRFRAPLEARQVVGDLQGYDLLAVPSLLLETGPLVVLEAFAAGVPVLGSRLGGIAEIVRHGVNGLLVEPGSVEGWRLELQRICEDRNVLGQLRGGIHPPRKMATVAEEMHSLYRALIDNMRRN